MRILICAAALLIPADVGAQGSGDDDKSPLPLPPDRTLAIDMTVGSWISLDISPDGQTIVFDHLGNLFTVPITGGDATQLTSGMAFDAQPRFSPDGTRIVFTSDRSGGQNVWIMSLDGTDTVQVTKGASNRTESPDWSPDGDYVVASKGGFRGGGLPKLSLYHVDGGSGVQLISEPDNLKTLGAAFDPTGRYIWYARRNSDWTYNAQFPQYQLAVYDRETGENYTRTSRYGSGVRPTPSPDGRWLVYGTRHDFHTGLRIRDLESGDERWLAYPVQHDDQESRATLDVLPGMSFTPDSRHLVASYGGKIWKLDVIEGGAEEIPFRVQYDLELGPLVEFDYPIEDTPTFTVRQIRDAVPSPDGSRIAFTALDRLWVANADGTDPDRLTEADHSEHYPAWSPGGDWIAYATWDGEAGHLYKIRADGSGSPVRLTERGAVYITPAWSPAGDRIVALRSYARDFQESAGGFGSGAPQPGEIVWIADGDGPGAATLIAPVDGRRGPHFAEAAEGSGPSADRIYMQRGADMLVSIRWDGTDEREHVRIRGATPPGSQSALSPSVLRMAPRGDLVMALIQQQVYTATVPMVGGEAPLINVGNPGSAQMPARKLTDMGGEFPAWAASGRAVHWSLGRAFFTYDLDAAEAFEEAREASREEEESDEAEEGEGEEAEEGEEEDEEDDDSYKPVEVWIDIQADRDIPNGTALLTNARVITVADAGVIDRADILIRDNRIAAVGPSGSLDVPADARVFDLAGKTVVPGFVDTHAHMRPANNLHRSDVWPYLANLAYGVTTTRDPQTGTTDVLSYADRVRTGELVGPRVYSTGPGVFWQHMIGSEDEARDILSKYSEYFDTKTIKMYVAGNRQQRQWIIMAARELGLMPTTEGSLNIRQNLNETIDGYPGLEHSIPIYPVYDDYVQLFVATQRAYSPTLLVSYGGPWAENYFFSRENPHDDAKLRRFVPHSVIDGGTLRRAQWFRDEEHVFADHARFVKDLVEAGGRAGVGSHGQLQGLGYHWELWAMAAGGMDEHDALRVATILGAEAIGLDGDLGSIEAGKLADLVVLDANPLDDIRNTNRIYMVMINGRLYDADTLAEQYPGDREVAPLWWWDDEPAGVPGVGGTEMCYTPFTHWTRRSFVTGSAGAAAAFALSPALRALDPTIPRPHLQIALEAWKWLDSHRIETPYGITWPADPTDPASTGYTLYTHSPGVLPFALELYHATGDQQYLDAAAAGADHLAATLDAGHAAGLYTGLAGIAFVLAETWRATGRDEYREDAVHATRVLVEDASTAGGGIAWPIGSGEESRESTDIINGTSGTGLGLLYLHRVLGDDGALDAAQAAGARLLELALETETGLRWDMWPNYPREMPNFSHGTAGIAYFLATLHRATGDDDFLQAALAGARYLISQATQDGDATSPRYRIFHSRPGGEDLYYLSWCHGPVGTNRLFHQLAEATGDDEWNDWVARGARGVMSTGIPEQRTPGFWDNIGQCCGTADAAEHFLTLYRTTGNPDYRAFVDRLNADLVSRGTAIPSERTNDGVHMNQSGRKWTQAEHRVQPDLLVAQTGHMQGAAGVGKYFLHMDAMEERGEGPRVVLPDDPW